MKLIHSILFLLYAFSPWLNSAKAQALISGPTCVVAGIVYQYDINTRWDSVTLSHICVTGGLLSDSNNLCSDGITFASIKVIWNDSSAGQITAHLPDADTIFSVDIIKPMDPGKIDSSFQTQLLDSLTVPEIIVCSYASGGSCSPQYSYTWQESSDGINWNDIDSAQNSSMTFDVPLLSTTYYRRKAKDTGSGTISYSNVAAVFVIKSN